MFFKIVPCFQLTVGLDKSRRCVRDVLEMMNCTIAVLHYFLTSTLMNTPFQFTEYVKQF